MIALKVKLTYFSVENCRFVILELENVIFIDLSSNYGKSFFFSLLSFLFLFSISPIYFIEIFIEINKTHEKLFVEIHFRYIFLNSYFSVDINSYFVISLFFSFRIFCSFKKVFERYLTKLSY